MNAADVGIVLGLIASRYPNARLGEDAELTHQAWAMTLDDVPIEETRAVLAEWFKVKRFAPDPSEIRDAVLTAVGLIPDGELAWKMARDRSRDWYPGMGWRNGQEPPALPAPVEAAVKSLGGVTAIIEGEVTREAFLKVYAVYRARYAAEVNMTSALGMDGGRQLRAIAGGR